MVFQKISYFLIAVILSFLAGSFLGASLMRDPISDVASQLRQSELSTESYLLEQELITESTNCDFARTRIKQHSDALYLIGKRLEAEDAREQLGEQDYTYLKQKFHLLQIRTYTLYRTLNQKYDFHHTVILFYFGQSNNESAEQGKVLDSLVLEYPIIVFAIEYNYDNKLSFLEEYYAITTVPSLVLDFEKVLPGKQDRNTLIRYLEHDNQA